MCHCIFFGINPHVDVCLKLPCFALSRDIKHVQDQRGDARNKESGQKSGQQGGTTPEEQVQKIIEDAERARATMFEAPGKTLNVSQIDEDYQMIDAHDG